MGIIYADLRLANHARSDLEEIDARALVDADALHLCIPERVALQLQLQPVETREVILADGKSRQVPYVAPVRIELLGRHSVCGALVFGDQVLLGGNRDGRPRRDRRTGTSARIDQSESAEYSDVGSDGEREQTE